MLMVNQICIMSNTYLWIARNACGAIKERPVNRAETKLSPKDFITHHFLPSSVLEVSGQLLIKGCLMQCQIDVKTFFLAPGSALISYEWCHVLINLYAAKDFLFWEQWFNHFSVFFNTLKQSLNFTPLRPTNPDPLTLTLTQIHF